MLEKMKQNKMVIVGLSFVLAIGLWAYITSEESVEVSQEVLLEINTPEGFAVVQKSSDTVTVILSAPRNILSLLERQPIRVSHTIEDVGEIGKYSFSLKPQDVIRPSGPLSVKVQQIIPERIVVTIDQMINKRLPIVPHFINEPAAGYKINKEGMQIDPNAVLVSGAQAVLDKMDAIQTEPIDIIGRIRSFSKKVSLVSSVDYTIQNPGVIDVFVPVIESFAQKACVDVPIKLLANPQKNDLVTIVPDKVSFTLKGPGQIIETLDISKILAYVDIVQLGAGKYKLPLQINLPAGVALSETVPVIDVSIGDKQPNPSISSAVISVSAKSPEES